MGLLPAAQRTPGFETHFLGSWGPASEEGWRLTMGGGGRIVDVFSASSPDSPQAF